MYFADWQAYYDTIQMICNAYFILQSPLYRFYSINFHCMLFATFTDHLPIHFIS